MDSVQGVVASRPLLERNERNYNCTHGLGDTAGAFDVIRPLLAKENYRVLAIDLSGQGSPVTQADMVFIKLLKQS